MYISREYGGKGFIGAKDCHPSEYTFLVYYFFVARNNNPLTNIIFKVKESQKHGVISYLKGKDKGSTSIIDDKHEVKLLEMKLRGNYFKQQNIITDIDIEISIGYLKSTGKHSMLN